MSSVLLLLLRDWSDILITSLTVYILLLRDWLVTIWKNILITGTNISTDGFKAPEIRDMVCTSP